MTEKRFKHSELYLSDGQLIYSGIEDTEIHYVYNMFDEVTVQSSEEQLINLLNNLHEENEQLKQHMDNLFDYFYKWFEEERGIYIEEFIELWESKKELKE